jgi:hypothetical protein
MRHLAFLALLAACRPPGYGKHAPDAADDSNADAAIDTAIADTAAAVCHKDFRLDGHGTASTVMLTGDFTMWGGDPAHGAIPFVLGADGGWTGSHDFAQGTYQYKFVVDGTQWIADPTNPDTVDDGFGGVNSVYTCTP